MFLELVILVLVYQCNENTSVQWPGHSHVWQFSPRVQFTLFRPYSITRTQGKPFTYTKLDGIPCHYMGLVFGHTYISCHYISQAQNSNLARVLVATAICIGDRKHLHYIDRHNYISTKYIKTLVYVSIHITVGLIWLTIKRLNND